MKRWLIAITMVLSIATANADQLNVEGDLTAEQKAQLQLQAAQMASKNGSSPLPSTPAQLTEWAEFGSAIGKGLAGTAKELGVAADTIADTKVGMFAMVLIAWHYAGEELISIIFGFVWLLFTLPVWIWMYRRQFIVESVKKFDKDKNPDGLRKQVSFRDYDSSADGLRAMYWVTLLLLSAVGFLPILV